MLATEGLQNVSTWSAHIRELHSWKLSHTQPQPLRRVNVKPTALPKDQTLRQQFSDQSSMQAAKPEGDQWSIPQQQQQQQQQQQPVQALYPSRQYAPSAADAQASLQITSSPHIGMQQSASMPATPAQQQQPTELPAAPASTSTQQLSPSQRRAQSSSLFSAIAAATSMPSSKRASEAGVGYPTVGAATSDRAAIFASPAAQAARAYASPEPSPEYPLQTQSGFAGSPTELQYTEMAASPISPEAATQAAIAEMRSLSALSAVTDAKMAQTGPTDLPDIVSSQQEFEPVPVMQSRPTLCASATAAPAPVSIPAPIVMSTTVSLPALQEPLYAPLPGVKPTVVQPSLLPPAIPFQPAALPVTAPTTAPPLRPVGAFSYTAPAPPSTDRYIPAIGYSPSRARVARDPPADAVMGHLRKQSFAGSIIDPPPALPQQASFPREGATATILSQEAVPVATMSSRSLSAAPVTIDAAPMGMNAAHIGMGRVTAQSSGAVYGPGVTSTPLAQPATAIYSDTTYSHPVLNQTAVFAPMTAAGEIEHQSPQLVPQTEVVSSSAACPPPVLTTACALEATPIAPTVLSAGPAPMLTTSPGVAQSDGTAAMAAMSSATAAPTPVWANTAQATGATISSINPGGQAMVPGPVAEGVQSSSEASATDNWSDADSDMSVPYRWHGTSAAGPVCEGVETNSDVWSDSASSNPGSPLSASQPVASLAAQPTKQSRFGKLLSRAKGSSGSGAAAPAAASTAVEQDTEAAQLSGEAAETQLPAMMSSAAVPARTGMRSKLFGKARRQALPMPLAPAAEADNPSMTYDPESTSDRMAASAAEGFSQEQMGGGHGSIPSLSGAWQTRTADFSDELSQSDPATVPAPVPAVFPTSSSALLTSQHSPRAAFSHAQLPKETDEGFEAVDPLSHQFEERMSAQTSEATQAKQQGTASQSHQYAQHADQLATASGYRIRATSPSPSDAPSFDPLTATLEEFEAFNRSHPQRLSPELSEQFPGQLPDQSSGTSDLQQPQQLPAAASVQPRKTRSIPRIFRLRKTAPSSSHSSSPDVPMAESPLQPSEGTKGDTLQPGTELLEPRLTGPGPEQALVTDKPRSKPFGLLRKRSKGTAQLSLTQQPAQADLASPAEAYTSPAVSQEGTGQGLQQGLEPGLLGGAPAREVVGKDAQEQPHVNTVLGLSAGLTSTFGSFMAASSGGSPRASPSSPYQLPEEALPSQVNLMRNVLVLSVA